MTTSKITIPSISEKKDSGERITALTAYDYSMAKLVDESGIDIILVGDSASCVMQGNPTTLPITLDEMIYHCRCVTAAVNYSLVIGDLPFLSYQISSEKAIESAGRLIKEGGVAGVKLEGGVHVSYLIDSIVKMDIPVMGHVGLTPQSYHRMGGHKVQGRNDDAARVIDDALAVEDAGAFSIVLECIPHELAMEITSRLSIPTIGIGAGSGCDGQILVIHDMLGFSDTRRKFVKEYANLGNLIKDAVKRYGEEVKAGVFPSAENCFNDKVSLPSKNTQKEVHV